MKPPLFSVQALKGTLTILICFPAAAHLPAVHLLQHDHRYGFINTESGAVAASTRRREEEAAVRTRFRGSSLRSEWRREKSSSEQTRKTRYGEKRHPSFHPSRIQQKYQRDGQMRLVTVLANYYPSILHFKRQIPVVFQFVGFLNAKSFVFNIRTHFVFKNCNLNI